MTIPVITPYAGEVPNRAQEQAIFSVNVGNFLPYLTTFGAELNIATAWVDGKLTQINSDIVAGQDAIDLLVIAAADSAIESAGYAADSLASANLSASSANLKGNWSDLIGALNKPASVYHIGKFWALLNNLADVTTSRPSISADWAEIKSVSETVLISGNFTAEAGVKYDVSTADITLPTLTVGNIFNFHAITDNVRILNTSYTIRNGTRSIIAGDNLMLRNGQTVTMSAISSTELEIR